MRLLSGEDEPYQPAPRKHKRSASFAAASTGAEEQARQEKKVELLQAKEELWQERAQNFLASLHERYAPHFNDILQPASLAVHQVMFGLRLLRFGATAPASMRPDARSLLSDLVGDLAAFPTIECQSVKTPAIRRITSIVSAPALSALREAAAGIANRPRGMASMVLRSALCRAYLHIYSSRFLSRSALSLLDLVFSTFDGMWRRTKEREREAREKEAEFYKHRVRTKLHAIPDTEQDEQDELQDTFPSFWSDYDDLIQPEEKEEEQGKEALPATTSVPNSQLKDDEEDLQEWEVHQICSIHRAIHLRPRKLPTTPPAKNKRSGRSRAPVRKREYLTIDEDEKEEATLSVPLEEGREVNVEELIDVFELSYSTGAAVMRLLHHDAASGLDERVQKLPPNDVPCAYYCSDLLLLSLSLFCDPSVGIGRPSGDDAPNPSLPHRAAHGEGPPPQEGDQATQQQQISRRREGPNAPFTPSVAGQEAHPICVPWSG